MTDTQNIVAGRLLPRLIDGSAGVRAADNTRRVANTERAREVPFVSTSASDRPVPYQRLGAIPLCWVRSVDAGGRTHTGNILG